MLTQVSYQPILYTTMLLTDYDLSIKTDLFWFFLINPMYPVYINWVHTIRLNTPITWYNKQYLGFRNDCNYRHWNNCPSGDNISFSITCQSACSDIRRPNRIGDNHWCWIVDIYKVKTALTDNNILFLDRLVPFTFHLLNLSSSYEESAYYI